MVPVVLLIVMVAVVEFVVINCGGVSAASGGGDCMAHPS